MILVPRILDTRVLSPDQVSIGVVTKTFLDGDGRRLLALLVKPGPFKKSKILRVDDIERVGNDNVILAKGCSLIRKKDPRCRSLLRSEPSLVGRKVMSPKGKGLGRVRSAKYRLTDGGLESISISENIFVALSSGGYSVKSEGIISFSDNEIEVDEEKLISTGSILTDQMSVLGTKMAGLRRGAENLINSRERSFIIGKTSSHDITDETGEKVIDKGEIITDDHISRASKANKLHHLTLAAGKVEIRSRFQKWKDK